MKGVILFSDQRHKECIFSTKGEYVLVAGLGVFEKRCDAKGAIATLSSWCLQNKPLNEETLHRSTLPGTMQNVLHTTPIIVTTANQSPCTLKLFEAVCIDEKRRREVNTYEKQCSETRREKASKTNKKSGSNAGKGTTAKKTKTKDSVEEGGEDDGEEEEELEEELEEDETESKDTMKVIKRTDNITKC